MSMENQVLSEVNMTEKSLEDGVQHVIDWLRKQPHLPNTEDKEFLKGFIIASKSVEKSKGRLERYYSSRTKHPNIFGIRDPTKLEWNRLETLVFLPVQTKENYSVLFVKLPFTKEGVKAYDLELSVKTWFMLFDHRVRHHPFTSGHYVFIDCQGLSPELLLKFGSLVMATAADVYENALPLRMKAMVWFNSPSLAATFYNTIFKYFYSEKLRARIVVESGDHSVLLKYVPQEILPSNYGGNSPSLEQLYADTRTAMEKDREWFVNEGSSGSDETKRPLSAATPQQLHGTFTKLEID